MLQFFSFNISSAGVEYTSFEYEYKYEYATFKIIEYVYKYLVLEPSTSTSAQSQVHKLRVRVRNFQNYWVRVLGARVEYEHPKPEYECEYSSTF